MFFFTPRHIRQGKAFLKDAHKLLSYKRDIWNPEAVARFEQGLDSLRQALKDRDKAAIASAAEDLDKQAATLEKPRPDAAWRENCEVILVAVVIALGVRTYFLQPFTIPTGSMQPTLNGIIGYPTQEQPPNLLTRLYQKAIFGRTWVDVVAPADDVIIKVEPTKSYRIFDATLLYGEHGVYKVNCPQDTLIKHLLKAPLFKPFKAGDVIARGYFDTGDHVFVDKFTYHFRKPSRADVFVFNTQGLATPGNIRNSQGQGPSQFYIKRVGGLPGDTLQIQPPILKINGQQAQEPAFLRVMAAKDKYRGYSNEAEHIGSNGSTFRTPMTWLASPEQTFQVPPGNYFALGDNSFNSSDSRDWGPVPQQNVVGRGILVYWPFTSHWGPIR